jgi:hypothetical protein
MEQIYSCAFDNNMSDDDDEQTVTLLLQLAGAMER